MKVSYLIGLYNKLDYITECIESILNEINEQIDIEICIVDDGSTDGSFELINTRYRNNPNIKIHKFEKNLGKNSAYNKAYEISTGDYICIFGADDVVIPNRTIKMLEKSIKDKKAVYGGLIIKNYNLMEEYSRKIPMLPSFYEISMFNFLSGGCVLIPRDLCAMIFPIPLNLKFEDWWISYILVKNKTVCILDDYVTIYRVGSNNSCATNDDNFKEYYDGKLRDLSRHFDYIECFSKVNNNAYLDKSLDIRRVVFKQKPSKIIYPEFDKFSFMIFFIYLFGPKLFFVTIFFLKKIKKNTFK